MFLNLNNYLKIKNKSKKFLNFNNNSLAILAPAFWAFKTLSIKGHPL